MRWLIVDVTSGRDSWNASITAFWLTLDSELVFVGDAGTTEANDASERTGVEATLFWRPEDWLALDASAAWTDPKFDIAGPANRIPNAVETVLAGGAVFHSTPSPFLFARATLAMRP